MQPARGFYRKVPSGHIERRATGYLRVCCAQSPKNIGVYICCRQNDLPEPDVRALLCLRSNSVHCTQHTAVTHAVGNYMDGLGTTLYCEVTHEIADFVFAGLDRSSIGEIAINRASRRPTEER